jgi:hypothetical protein
MQKNESKSNRSQYSASATSIGNKTKSFFSSQQNAAHDQKILSCCAHGSHIWDRTANDLSRSG